MNEEYFKVIKLFCVLCFLYLSLSTICGSFAIWVDYKNKESKRAIMFKLSDSNYVCEDLMKFSLENL